MKILENVSRKRRAVLKNNCRNIPELLAISVSKLCTRSNKIARFRFAVVHRRSLSEDIGLIVFPSANSPSDKARCHLLSQQNYAFHPPLKHVGESMYQEDPHYKPSSRKSNPFASLSKFKGVKKVLAQTNSTDLFSSCFELPSPFYGADDRKPSFYTEEPDPRTKTSPDRVPQLPHPNEKSSAKRFADHRTSRSSIIIESVVKPSEIKKCSSTSFKFKSSSEEPSIRDVEPCRRGARTDRKSATTISSSSSSSSGNTSSTTLRLKGEAKSKTEKVAARFENYKPSSLPSSPTFSRRRTNYVSNFNFRFPACKTDDAETNVPSGPKKAGSIFLYPLYKSRGCLTDTLLTDVSGYGNPLRSCSSSSNISALEECPNAVFLPPAETPTLNLRRRGSCESGFYSSVGDDFYVPGKMSSILGRTVTKSFLGRPSVQ